MSGETTPSASPRRTSRQLTLFVCVGIASTLTYLVLAWALSAATPLPTAVVSLLAYALAAIPSYLAHRRLTFAATSTHRTAAPRYAGLSVIGYLLAFATPIVLEHLLGSGPVFAIAGTCIVVASVNYIGMNHLVFAATPGAIPPDHWGSRGA